MTMTSVRKAVGVATVGMFAVASFAMAQDTTTSTGGWRRVGDPQVQSTTTNQVQSTSPNSDNQTISQSNPNPGNYPDSSYPAGQTAAQAPSYPPPQQQNYPPFRHSSSPAATRRRSSRDLNTRCKRRRLSSSRVEIIKFPHRSPFQPELTSRCG